MNKKCIRAIPIIIFILTVAYFLEQTRGQESSYKNGTFLINGVLTTLVDGYAEAEIPGSASKIVTRYFGNEILYDLDDDGREDVVFLVTQETGGSGVFFYVVAALNKEGGYVGSKDAYFLGDRIAPQGTHMSTNPRHKNVIVINYADRKPGESFAVSPSEGKSVWLKLNEETVRFGIVAQNFEGESDQTREEILIKIGGKTVKSEVADTPEKRFLGLSGRPSLSADFGMWFVFEKEGSYGFWMKDMFFPIDIIWVSNNLEVVDFVENLSPETYPKTYPPKATARYALEVEAGFVKANQIKLGSRVEVQKM